MSATPLTSPDFRASLPPGRSLNLYCLSCFVIVQSSAMGFISLSPCLLSILNTELGLFCRVGMGAMKVCVKVILAASSSEGVLASV